MTNRSVRRAFILSTLAALVSVACVRTRAPSIARDAVAPAFTLNDETGKPVSLGDLTANGPALVVFYRGYW